MENGSKTIEPLTEKGLLAFRECITHIPVGGINLAHT